MIRTAAAMRTISDSTHKSVREMELADLKKRITAWKKWQKERSAVAIGKLAAFIKSKANEGGSRVIAQMMIGHPHLAWEIGKRYSVLDWFNFDRSFIFPQEFTVDPSRAVKVTYRNSKYLLEDGRRIARWLLREKFRISVIAWHWDPSRFKKPEVLTYPRIPVIEIDEHIWNILALEPTRDPVKEGILIEW
jgi:hypothetical protein